MGKTIVVLCPPRSGSSLLAGILSKLGVFMGDEKYLTRLKNVNPLGCYEDEDFKKLNYSLLADCGCNLNFSSAPKKEQILSLKGKYKNKINRLVAKRKNYPLWGWKNVSWTPYTIPLLHQFLPNPHYIVLKRNMNSIVKSSMRIKQGDDLLFRFIRNPELWRGSLIFGRLKDKLTGKNPYSYPNKLRNVFTQHYKIIDEFVKGKKYITLDFENILKYPEKNINKLVKFIGCGKENFNKALEFVHPEFVHFRGSK